MILFFVRRYNDVDHLTPVVWAVARDGARAVRVLCLNPEFDIHADYRLAFLRTLPNVEVAYVYDAHAPSVLYWMVARLMCGRTPLSWLFRRFLLDRLWPGVLRARLYTVDWAAGLLRTLQSRILIFDWVKTEQHVAGPLLAAARELRVPTVGLPHGVSITTAEFRTTASVRAGRLPDYSEVLPFDWFVVAHHDHADYFARGGMPRRRMAVLGSARFCDEWVRKGIEIAPRFERPASRPGALKVVYIDMKSFSSKRAVVAETLGRLARLDFIDLVVKPHTRKAVTDFPVHDRIHVEADAPSVSVLAWADVVIGTVSSVLIEPLCQGKPLLYPSYQCGISSHLEEMHACWRVDSDAELETALRRLHAMPGSAPTSEDNIARCLHRLVYADRSDHDVLRRYDEHILSWCREADVVHTLSA